MHNMHSILHYNCLFKFNLIVKLNFELHFKLIIMHKLCFMHLIKLKQELKPNMLFLLEPIVMHFVLIRLLLVQLLKFMLNLSPQMKY